jgi:adenylate cyclase
VDEADDTHRADLAEALDVVETYLLGDVPTLTRIEVCEQAGVPIEVAEELWRRLGFPHQADDAVAFTPADVRALEYTRDLMELGVLSAEHQAALVRTWGRSYARLAEWQTRLLTDVALQSPDPAGQVADLASEVLPRVEALQSYVWRRHLASAGNRLLAGDSAGSDTAPMAVVFVDIVGFTSRSKELDEAGLVRWVEYFEDECSGLVVDHGGRVIKNIGDEVLFVVDDAAAAADVALTMTARGSDPDDAFPEVRAGLAYGDVVSRLGDVFGPTVNIASRLTSLARPGSVLVDRGAHDVLTEDPDDPDDPDDHEHGDFAFRRMRRTSVKGYARLQAWVLRRAGS